MSDNEDLQQQLNKAIENIQRLKLITGTLIAWLSQELGHNNAAKLLDQIEDIE